MPLRRLADKFEEMYAAHNRKECARRNLDPVHFLYDYDEVGDREIAGFVASSLAYGRVRQICNSVSNVLERLGPHLRETVANETSGQLRARLRGFKHRFSTGEQVADLLWAMGRLIERHGSLERALAAHLKSSDRTLLSAMAGMAGDIRSLGVEPGHLLPDVGKGSACKRLNLLARWMCRRDDVDPGGWESLGLSRLIIPLDTHMHRIGTALGGLRRNQADLRAAMELTEAFRKVRPDDPVRYDFVLTHVGIAGKDSLQTFLRDCRMDDK